MMKYRLVKKGLVLGIIVLLLAVIFTPYIYADVNKINHLLQKGGYSDATGSSELKLVRIRGWPSPDPNAPGIFIVGDVKNVGDAVFSDLIDRSGKIHPWLNPSKILAIDGGSWMGKISPGETSTVCNIYVEEEDYGIEMSDGEGMMSRRGFRRGFCGGPRGFMHGEESE